MLPIQLPDSAADELIVAHIAPETGGCIPGNQGRVVQILVTLEPLSDNLHWERYVPGHLIQPAKKLDDPPGFFGMGQLLPTFYVDVAILYTDSFVNCHHSLSFQNSVWVNPAFCISRTQYTAFGFLLILFMRNYLKI